MDSYFCDVVRGFGKGGSYHSIGILCSYRLISTRKKIEQVFFIILLIIHLYISLKHTYTEYKFKTWLKFVTYITSRNVHVAVRK